MSEISLRARKRLSSGLPIKGPATYSSLVCISASPGFSLINQDTRSENCFTNGTNSTAFMTLNTVCIMAMCWAMVDSPASRLTRARKGLKSMMAHIDPITLNKMWIQAARLAFVLAPIEARRASMVVPMLQPRTSPAAISKPMTPSTASVMTMAVDALDEWMMTVSTVPAATAIRMEMRPRFETLARNLTTSADGFGMAWDRKSSPRKSRPKPRAASP